MASTFPTSLDTFTNPTATSLLTSPSHAQQHADINDAVEALEAKVAIGNTVLGTYTDYTPTFPFGVTIGDGVGTGAYCRVNGFVHVYGKFTLGSTSAITSAIYPGLPVNVGSGQNTNAMLYGVAQYWDVSAGTKYPGIVEYPGNSSYVILRRQSTFTTNVTQFSTDVTQPFTWATGDVFTWNIYYKAA